MDIDGQTKTDVVDERKRGAKVNEIVVIPSTVPAGTKTAPSASAIPASPSTKQDPKALYNGRCLEAVLKKINQILLMHLCLFVHNRRLTKRLSYRNRHRCFRKTRFIFLSISLSTCHCTRPKRSKTSANQSTSIKTKKTQIWRVLRSTAILNYSTKL